MPTALPGWTRKHLVAHLAGNAEALLRLLHWAGTGERTPMYTSPEQRNADIESLALPISSAWLYVPLLPAGLVTVAQALADLVQLLRRSVERAA